MSPTRSSKLRPLARVPSSGRYCLGMVIESPTLMPSFADFFRVARADIHADGLFGFGGPFEILLVPTVRQFHDSVASRRRTCAPASDGPRKSSNPSHPEFRLSSFPSLEIDFTEKPISSICATTRIFGVFFPAGTRTNMQDQIPRVVRFRLSPSGQKILRDRVRAGFHGHLHRTSATRSLEVQQFQAVGQESDSDPIQGMRTGG